MALPEIIRVKISSEVAEFISITPVVVREMPARELIEAMLGVTGKDAARVREILHRGSLVEGASRFRWDALDADQPAIESVLATFPDPDPARPFTPALCLRAVLKGPNTRIDIPRQAGSERRLFRKRSFWDVLMEFSEAAAPRYLGYSYRERADHYAHPRRARRVRPSMPKRGHDSLLGPRGAGPPRPPRFDRSLRRAAPLICHRTAESPIIAASMSRRTQALLLAALLFALNLWIVRELLTAEFIDHMYSIEGTHISIARFALQHWPDLRWFPLWYGGIPYPNTYAPLHPLLVAAEAKLLGTHARARLSRRHGGLLQPRTGDALLARAPAFRFPGI